MKRKYFAVNSWAVEDVLDLAEQLEIEISEKEANELLRRQEKHLIDVTVKVGWDYLEYALHSRGYSSTEDSET